MWCNVDISSMHIQLKLTIIGAKNKQHPLRPSLSKMAWQNGTNKQMNYVLSHFIFNNFNIKNGFESNIKIGECPNLALFICIIFRLVDNFKRLIFITTPVTFDNYRLLQEIISNKKKPNQLKLEQLFFSSTIYGIQISIAIIVFIIELVVGSHRDN